MEKFKDVLKHLLVDDGCEEAGGESIWLSDHLKASKHLETVVNRLGTSDRHLIEGHLPSIAEAIAFSLKRIEGFVLEMTRRESTDYSFILKLLQSLLKALSLSFKKYRSCLLAAEAEESSSLCHLKLLASMRSSLETIKESIKKLIFEESLPFSSSDLLISAGIGWCFVVTFEENIQFRSLFELITCRRESLGSIKERTVLALFCGALNVYHHLVLVNDPTFFETALVHLKSYGYLDFDVITNIILTRSYLLWIQTINRGVESLDSTIRLGIKEAVAQVLAFACSKWENSYDLVCDQSFDIIKCSMQVFLCVGGSNEELAEYLLKKLEGVRYTRKGTKLRALATFAEVIGVEVTSDYYPKLSEDVLAFLGNTNDFPTFAVTLTAGLLNSRFKSEFLHRLWTLLQEDEENLVINQFLPKLFKKNDILVKDLVVALKEQRISDVRVTVGLLKVISSSDDKKWEESKEYIQRLIEEAVHHFDEQVRLDALSLVLLSKKSTKVLTETDLATFRSSFQQNITFQMPANRSNYLTLIKKLFQRMRETLCTQKRAIRPTEVKQRYTRLIQWTICECLDNLYYGCYYGQTVTCLRVLQLCVEVLGFQESDVGLKMAFRGKREGRYAFSTLLVCLMDSYEENKRVAFDLLVQLSANDVFSIGDSELKELRETAFYLSSSINPSYSMIAAYLFRLTCKLKALNLGQGDACFELLVTIVDDLETAIKEAESSIITAASHNPIHTRLVTVHALLSDVDFNLVVGEDVKTWSFILKRVIKLCFAASSIVREIVCNDSPEGHFPMDCEPVSEQFLCNALNGRPPTSSEETSKLTGQTLSNEKRRNITSQMLLICGWKTMKESSLLLGDLCLKMPSVGHNPDLPSLLYCQDIEEILNYFSYYLKELKHRGAFEQTYVGFTTFSAKVWQLNCSHSQLISNMLIDVLNELIESKSLENDMAADLDMLAIRKTLKTCTTRRSAGLPFIVQAVLASVPATKCEPLFSNTLNSLLELAERPEIEEWRLIHSLNVLRAVFRDHRLASSVDPFVEKGLFVAINTFGSTSYGVRNSSCLLFSALITRVFGVNLPQDQAKKNMMSSKHFFLRFPSLFSFFKKKMKKQSKDILQNPNESSDLYPIVLILIRLWPSSCDSFDVTAFRPLLTNICRTCPHFRVRQLASRVLGHFILGNEQGLDGLVQEMDSVDVMLTNNKAHGQLMVILQLICNSSRVDLVKASPLVTEWLERQFRCLLTDVLPMNGSFSAQFEGYNISVAIFEELMKQGLIESRRRQELLKVLTEAAFKIMMDRNHSLGSNNISLEEFLVKVVMLSILRTENIDSVKELIVTCLKLQDNMINVKLAVLLLFKKSILCSCQETEGWETLLWYDYPFNTSGCQLVMADAKTLLQDSDVRAALFECEEVTSVLMGAEVVSEKRIAIAVEVLYLHFHANNWLKEFGASFSSLSIKQVLHCLHRKLSDEVRLYVILASSNIVRDLVVDLWDNRGSALNVLEGIERVNSWCLVIEKEFTADQDLTSRRVVAKVIQVVLKKVLEASEALNGADVCPSTPSLTPGLISLFTSLLKLLQDDELTIRQIAVQVIDDILPSNANNTVRQPMTSQLALKSCVNFFCCFLKQLNESERAVVTLSKWILEKEEEEEENLCDYEERLFEKSKHNLYEDKICLIEASSCCLKTLQVDNFNDMNLTSLLEYVDIQPQSNSCQHIVQALENNLAVELDEVLGKVTIGHFFLDPHHSLRELQVYKKLTLYSCVIKLKSQSVALQESASSQTIRELVDQSTHSALSLVSPLIHKCLLSFHKN